MCERVLPGPEAAARAAANASNKKRAQAETVIQAAVSAALRLLNLLRQIALFLSGAPYRSWTLLFLSKSGGTTSDEDYTIHFLIYMNILGNFLSHVQGSARAMNRAGPFFEVTEEWAALLHALPEDASVQKARITGIVQTMEVLPFTGLSADITSPHSSFWPAVEFLQHALLRSGGGGG